MAGILPQEESDPRRKDFCAKATASELGRRLVERAFHFQEEQDLARQLRRVGRGRREKEEWETWKRRKPQLSSAVGISLSLTALPRGRFIHTQAGPSQAFRTRQ